METSEVRTVVWATLAVIQQISTKTRTPADEILVRILQRNFDQLATAVESLARQPEQPPTPEQVKAALQEVGVNT